ncbi:MAG TPA: 4'-phosphopantetheinyl transferase superfamily protein [Verrucomicrobiae bacterium]|jgi:phosphopantetheine--protein transferase-like protein|nr:4'-phosphopantetheinyl transferase superfamily protein [Verrucomicrobiae bacterium]
MNVLGVGIDLISLKRVRKFLRHPKSQIRRLLTPAEQKRYLAKNLSPVVFAKLFSAKEAYFKAAGGGIPVFERMDVKLLPRDRFQVKSLHGLRSAAPAYGCFFRTPSLIGAQIILWD